MKKIIITVVTLGMLASAQSVSADSVYISNSVSNSVSTGGNTGGSVTEGVSSASVSVHTEVNGQVVSDIHEEKSGTGDQSISVSNFYATSSSVQGGESASTSITHGLGSVISIGVGSTSKMLSEMKDRISEFKRNLKSLGEVATSSASTSVAASSSSKGEVSSIGQIGIVIKNIFNYVFSLFTF